MFPMCISITIAIINTCPSQFMVAAGNDACEPSPQTSLPVLFVFKECALFSEDQEGSQLDPSFMHSDRTGL